MANWSEQRTVQPVFATGSVLVRPHDKNVVTNDDVQGSKSGRTKGQAKGQAKGQWRRVR